jgi:hypothetical protein
MKCLSCRDAGFDFEYIAEREEMKMSFLERDRSTYLMFTE